jgi:hypothetical protein
MWLCKVEVRGIKWLITLSINLSVVFDFVGVKIYLLAKREPELVNSVCTGSVLGLS